MPGKKIISIRFRNDDPADMKLYELLEREAGISASLASVAKARIRESYQSGEQNDGNMEFQEKLVRAVREEIQKSGMQMAGTFIACMNGKGMAQADISADENRLPDKSGELPNGAFDFLEQ
jgi:hypothetical protein